MTRVGAGLAVALLLGACGGGGGDDEEADSGEDSPTETTAPAVPEGTTYYAEANTAEVQIYDAEDATEPTQALAHPTERGVPLVFLVDGTDIEGERLPVHLPVKPNGATGWVDAAQVELTANPYSIKVELANHHLTVSKGTEVIIDTQVGLGAAGAETPVGTYFVKELLQNPNPDDAYGPYAYGISAFTENPEVADQFGGDGVIGVHGTNDPSSIGQNVSHGCIRLPNEVITEMANTLPLGTPIEILA
jgi:lipoprotein-anchoring transpeptidase ErfK/SrfK